MLQSVLNTSLQKSDSITDVLLGILRSFLGYLICGPPAEYLRPSTYNNETKTALKPISHFKHELRFSL